MHSQGTSPPLTLYMQPGVVAKGQRRYWRNGRPTGPTLVLLYVAETGVMLLSPMEVRHWVREKLGIELDRRRIHDAFMDLVRRGILERVKRGFYRVKNAARALAELAKRVEAVSGCTRVATDAGARLGSCARRRARRGGSGLVGSGDGCFVVARWHRRVGRGSPLDWLVGLFLSLGVAEGFARCARRRVRELLRRAGFSKYRLRRLSSRIQELIKKLCSCEIRVGAHGAGDGRFYPWEELVELALGIEKPWLVWREFGVDVVYCPGVRGEAVAGNGGYGGDALGDPESFVEELREVLGSQQVYVPVNGAGARR